MKNLQLTQVPIAKAEMLIRKPVAEVFEAFVKPEITTRFWFTKSSGRLEAGKHITWTWEMYDISVQVDVKEIKVNKRILIEWGNYGSMTTVEWIFTPYENDTTYVTITNSGFKGDGDKVVSDALDSKGGFTWVLAGLKALLEHDMELNAIADAFPKGLREH
ncbi:MAG TPA: SRPBCC family protein [Pyrinomonadaceae bacterium]|nr:SRPBCC family protein [Pyrinomonadaceae bacterium]